MRHPTATLRHASELIPCAAAVLLTLALLSRRPLRPPCADFRVSTKCLTNKGLHTWHGMLGYIKKDLGLPHFTLVSKNVSEEALPRQPPCSAAHTPTSSHS